MAIIAPYGDPSAHGKVTPGLAFRRLGPRVTFGANRRPRNKNTAGQQTQRDKIRQAVQKYRILNFEEKIFLRRRGSMKSKTLYNLYTSSQLKGNDWSKIQGHQLQTINDMVIYDLQQFDPNDVKFTLLSSNTKDITDNIILYSKFDSETAGIISSVIGPDFTWAGTPNHDPLKFLNGVWSYANNNLIKSNDDGDFLLQNFDEFLICFWVELTFDLINGVPQDGLNHYMMDWQGNNSPGGINRIAFQFRLPSGLQFFVAIDGVTLSLTSDDPLMTYSAGEKIFISVAYKKTGIDSEPINLEISVGTETTMNKIITEDITLPTPVTTPKVFSVLAFNDGRFSLKGGIDNIKAIKKVTRKTIDEIEDTRNVEQFEAELGFVLDNSNIFTPGFTADSVPVLKLKIENFSANDWRVPFYWALGITWSNVSITERTTLIRLPKTEVLSTEAVLFFLSQDMSSYFDDKLFRLGATDNV
jgi:hypothetical protein